MKEALTLGLKGMDRNTCKTYLTAFFLLFCLFSYSQNPIQGNSGFQVLTEGNFTSNGGFHIHGPLGVGGNLIINNTAMAEVNMDPVGSYVFPGDGSASTGLLVAGSVTWTAGNMRVLNSKYIHVGNSTGSLSGDNGNNSNTQVYPTATTYNNAKRIEGTIDQTPNPAVFQTNPFNFTTLFDTYRNNSFGLSNCTSNVQLYNSSGVAITGNTVGSAQNVVISSLTDGVNHLKLTPTSLNNITELKFQGTGIPSASKILIITVNVTANFVWNNSNMPGITGAEGQYILWNFYGASTFNITINTASQIIGNIFAPSFNLIKTGTGDIEGNIIAKTATLGLGEIHYFPFVGNAANCCSNITIPGTIAGNQSGTCGFDPVITTSSVAASGGSGTLEYRWDYSTNGGTTWVEIAGATSTTYNPGLTYTTTQYRRKARRRGCDTWAYSNIITITVTNSITANAGVDQTQCDNAAFTLIGNAPSAGQTVLWTIVAGSPLYNVDDTDDTIQYSLAAGSTATLRYTISNGTCSQSDDIVITNNTGCAGACINAINTNGDLENEGSATNFNLSFQSTPAVLITGMTNPAGWEERYGSIPTNTSTFQGAFYLKKTGASGDPHSGSHMIYLNGSGFCLSSMTTNARIACGKTYKFSAWIAAYSNGGTQNNAPFAMEFTGSSDSGTPAQIAPKIEMVAPASASWNDLNWQRFEFTIYIPYAGYTYADYYFTSASATSGIVIDDVCITELSSGSEALAGADQKQCSNLFTMAANTPTAGYTGLWTVVSGNASFSSTTSPSATVTLNAGNVATLRWTVTGGGCSSSDDVVVAYSTLGNITVNNATVCTGNSAVLTVSGCTGNPVWSTGATTPSITVSPATTTSYTVTCTVPASGNLVSNPGFESSTNFQNWSDWAHSSITTTALDVNTGAKAAKIDASTEWAGLGQDIAVNPGELYTATFWAKTNNINPVAEVGIKFFNSSYTDLSTWQTVRVNAYGYTQYTISGVAPAGAAWMQVAAWTSELAIMFVDDISVIRGAGCTKTTSATVTVSTSNPISLSTPVVSACINQPLMDVATVSVIASWTSAPPGDKIQVSHNNKIEYIDVASGLTSPQTVTFVVPANGTNGNVINASWVNTASCASSTFFNAPSPCSSDMLNCNILYLCGLDKPSDGDAFDHGIINYLTSVNSGSLTPALTKTDATGLGLYDANNPTTLLSINLNNYKFIVVSATTEGYLSNDLIDALKGFTGGILNMNYAIQDELGMTVANETYNYGNVVYTNNTNSINFYNYDNVNPTRSILLTGGNYKSQATGLLWYNANNASSNINGAYYKFKAHAIPSLSSTHGPRVHFGMHMNGFYANAQNGGALPAPVSSYFHPAKHLTIEAKAFFDQAIVDAQGCTSEICNNGIDDDGDGLTDCYDPDCNFVLNGEFDNTNSNWGVYTSNGAAATMSIDKTAGMSGLNSAKVSITTSTGTDWHVQLAQGNFTLIAGKTYEFSFQAKASSARATTAGLQLSVSPWTGYYWTTVNLTTTATTYTYQFTPTVTINNNVTLLFNLGTAAGTVWIDKVVLKEVCSTFTCGAGTCISDNLLSNGSFTTDYTGWTATNGQLSVGTGGTFGNFMVLNVSDIVGNYYVYQDVAFSPNAQYKFTGYAAKHGTSNNAKVYLEFYNGTTYLSKTADFNVTYNYDGNFQTITPFEGTTPANTTKIRVMGWANGTALKVDEFSLITCQPLTATITGASAICVGSTTTLSPTTGGTWSSSNPAIATVTNAGLVTGISAGAATFTYTKTAGGCVVSTGAVEVKGKPAVSITGPTTLCVGATTTLSPTTGGTWVSSNTAIATVTNAGVVTAIAAGSATFTFTQTSTGCVSNATGAVTVNAKPAVSITGGATLCVGATTTLSPTTGGTWASSNTAVATVTNAGVVTAIAAGSATFTFTQTTTGCVSDATGVVTINAKPAVSITGAATLCVGATTTLSPTTGGTWASSNTAIATVTNAGVVTAIAAGSATFTFTQTSTGCVSNATGVVTVNAKPAVSITGATTLCIGATTTLSPTTGGTWTSSNTAIATVTNAGVVTAIAAGSATFTFTQTSTTCISDATGAVTINAKPAVSITGSSSICIGSTTTLSPTTGGTWISSNTSVATVTNAGVVTAIAAGTATFTFTQTSTGCISNATNVVTVSSKPAVSITGPNSICIGSTTTLSPTSGGTWTSSNTAVATVTNAGVVTAVSAGSATFTFTLSGVCISDPTAPITINAKPTVSITGANSICTGATTTLSPTSGGTWATSNASIATITNAGIVTGISAGSATFTFTQSGSGCVSNASAPVTINPTPSVSLNYNGSVCLTPTSQLTAVPSSGTPAFIYSWTGPSSFTATTQTVNITAIGTYNLTLTDSKGCSASTSGFVYAQYVPTIASIQSDVCEGQSVDLTASATNTTSYLWNAAAGNATTQVVTVTPIYPSSAYVVTVTNNLGCTASATSTITVKQKPAVSITGASAICIGSSTNLSPNTGGTWTSSNNAIATVTNAGVVTGISSGTATFTFVSSLTSCTSNPTSPVTINPRPTIALTGPSAICKGSTTTLSPTTGGTWASSDNTVATVTNSGVVTGINQGTAFFTFTLTATGCTSNQSISVQVDDHSGANITGDNTLCVGETTTLNSNRTGTWSSSNSAIITVNNSGLVTAVAAGSASIIFSSNSGSCNNDVTFAIVVSSKPVVAITGPSTICSGTTTTLSPTSGGTWTSSNNAVATITNAGLVTGISAGSATFTFTNSASGCASNESSAITVITKPTVSISGPTTLCVGGTTQVLPSSGGIWTSSNDAVATVNSSGLVTAVAFGTVSFIYTDNATGCSSSSTTSITVNSKPNLTIDFFGSPCLTDTSKLKVLVSGGTSPYTYSWSGPSSFTSALQTINITNNGNYSVTVTDNKSCSANTTAFVYEQYNPLIVSLQTDICEGEVVNLTANGGGSTVAYQWSVNAGSSTNQSVAVYPTAPSSTYHVTVTNNVGCTAVATANISVDAKPVATITGPSSICIGGTSSLSPTSGGIWSSSNPAVATISNAGVVTGLSNGIATFTFTNSTSGCISDASAPISVGNKPAVNINGSSIICIGNTTTMSPSIGGIWTSTNPSVATINNSGVVTGVSTGTASFIFTVSGTECTSDPSAPVTVNQKPTTSIIGSNPICIGASTNLSPSSGGTWTSNNPSIASVSNDGIVSAINAGSSTFVFTELATGCTSLPTLAVVVNPKPLISLSGDSVLCIGETSQLTSSEAGTWTSVNPSVASVNNSGLITAIGPGQSAFIFTSLATGCSSNQSRVILVNPRPTVVINGPSSICIGSTTNLSPNTGGTWISNNPTIATVNNAGLVTALAVGQATFKYTESASGCQSNNTAPVIVYDKPTVQITGPANICVGGNSSVSPSTGGVWTSTNPSVAMVSGGGIVTGLSVGSSTFIYTESGSGCTSNASAPITVGNKPDVSVTGPTAICIGHTTTLSPSSGGIWISSNNSVATVSNTGLVTGIAQGVVTFTYQAAAGCISNPTSPITVNGKPNIGITGPVALCPGSTSQLQPSTGGIWSSSNPSVASISNTGLVTAVANGSAKFIFIENSTGCISDSSAAITVHNLPFVTLTGPGQICAGNTTTLSPAIGGVWSSSNTSIASVNNSGLVTGNNPGTASFYFTQLNTGCTSNLPISVTVAAKPSISLPDASICVGESITMTAPHAGTWVSNNTAVASITNAGVVTGISQGIARFTFTSAVTGCASNQSDPLVVNGRPSTSITGSSEICVGSTTMLSPSTGGTWISLNPSIASITNAGIVTGIQEGQAFFVFTDANTGCSSDGSTYINVTPGVSVSILGPSEICIGYQTQLTPNFGGMWTSSNPLVAQVINGGTVVGMAPGKVTFTFVESGTGCSSSLPADAIKVNNCLDPDFNATLVNITLNGNVSTNDEVAVGTTFGGGVMTESKPAGSNPSLIVNPNGSYTFLSSVPGVYKYLVPVCVPPLTYGCPTSNLVITVVDPANSIASPISNVDIATTTMVSNIAQGQAVTLQTVANDKCVLGGSCTLDNANVNITNLPHHGSAVINSNGTITYTPVAAFAGLDTLIYKICVSGEPTNCMTAKQIIAVNSLSASNSTVAADDFFVTNKGNAVTLNVKNNDSDPEGQTQTVTPAGTLASPIVIPQGTYYINSAGVITFTPTSSFSGPVDIIYTICDNAPAQACAKATAHILILDDMKLKLRVYLEGALIDNQNAVSSTGRPLMRDDLRVNPFTFQNNIPKKDPYKISTTSVDVTNMFVHRAPGNMTVYESIVDSASVFSVSGENAIVDWIFVELRSKDDSTVVLATRSGLLQRDGDVVDIDGVSDLAFAGISLDTFYVVVRHRLHLGVMSQKVTSVNMVDFTSPSTPVFDFGNSAGNSFDYTGLAQNTNVKTGYRAMWAGDFNADGKLKFTNPSDDINFLFYDVFSHPSNGPGNANYNFAYGYYQGDINMNGKIKFDNPEDDKNILYAQILFYPLNINYLSNFNYFVEQVPK